MFLFFHDKFQISTKRQTETERLEHYLLPLTNIQKNVVGVVRLSQELYTKKTQGRHAYLHGLLVTKSPNTKNYCCIL